MKILLTIIVTVLIGSCELSKPIRLNQTDDKVTVIPTSTPYDEVEPRYQGKYRNREFGFELDIPENLVGVNSPLPASQNGFVIRFSEGDSLSIYAEYNPLFYRDADRAFAQELTFLKQVDSQTKLLKKNKILLGNEPAIRFFAKYQPKDGSGVRLQDKTFSLRQCPGVEPKILYTLSLDTSETSAREHENVLNQVVKSWQMLENCE